MGLTSVLARAIQELDSKVDRQLTQGSDAAFGSVNVGGLASIQDLRVTGTATIANLHVSGTAIFDGDLVVTGGHIIGNPDTRGQVTVVAGQKSVHHDFAKPFDAKPVVVASPAGTNNFAQFSIDNDQTGFTIYLSRSVPKDSNFNYLVQQ